MLAQHLQLLLTVVGQQRYCYGAVGEHSKHGDGPVAAVLVADCHLVAGLDAQ